MYYKRGFVWIAQNNTDTDYVECSINLCRSIKSKCTHNQVAVITDKKTKVPAGIFDQVIVLEQDDSEHIEWKMNNEWKVFELSPFTHTIKLEADMLFTKNTDWWWNHLEQHDMVFSFHCRDYQDNLITNSPYRKLFAKNYLPDVYNGLHYFRRSQRAFEFYKICKSITKNWNYVRDNILIGCHDTNPTTDVVYALAAKIQDPTQNSMIKFEWFNFIHGKNKLNPNTIKYDNLNNYLHPQIINGEVFLGGYRIDRIWHYHKKDLLKEINDRIL